mmetsp:Transcript_2338/g.5549  ORF Transcript_2338/g.5549 Transcript_2338/m.5549 type:complete len:210 (-) Transcript_2338:1269-1898(-)
MKPMGNSTVSTRRWYSTKRTCTVTSWMVTWQPSTVDMNWWITTRFCFALRRPNRSASCTCVSLRYASSMLETAFLTYSLVLCTREGCVFVFTNLVTSATKLTMSRAITGVDTCSLLVSRQLANSSAINVSRTRADSPMRQNRRLQMTASLGNSTDRSARWSNTACRCTSPGNCAARLPLSVLAGVRLGAGTTAVLSPHGGALMGNDSSR